MRQFGLTFITLLEKESIIMIAASFFLLVFLIAIFVLFSHSSKKYEKEIRDLSNTTRIFVVDVKNDKVSFFNSAQLRKRGSYSITMFYNQYDAKERERLIAWIGDLLDQNTQTTKYLETSTYIQSIKQSVPSVLEVEKIDYKKQLIFIESHILQANYSAHKKGDRLSFNTKDYVFRKILTSNGKGTSIFFNFYNKFSKGNDISQLVYADLRDIILTFANENVLIFEEAVGQILVVNFDIKSKSDVLTFVNQIKSKINRYLSIKAYDEVCFSIGIINNSENFRDVNALLKNVIAVANLCKDTNEKIAFFNESQMLLANEQGNQYKTDVENLIEENRLNYYFQPVFDVDRGKIVAYQSSVVPVDAFFKDIDTLKSYSLRTEDDKELFSTIVRNTISRFVQENNERGVNLLLPISFNELSYAAQTLGRTNGVGDVKLVLVLKEKDLSELPETYEDERIINLLRLIKSKGYSVALEIDDDILSLTPPLYSVFDYFNLSVASHIQKKNAGHNLPSFQGLIEKLLHYNKPIIALEIQAWDIVELVYKLGISMICSDAIALPAENIMPLQKKMLAKILDLKS